MSEKEMETRNLTCIGCPMGCSVRVQIRGNEIIDISGNSCIRGEQYARSEVTSPTRTVTSSVAVTGGELARVSCKTSEAIPKDKIRECMNTIHSITVSAPVHIGDVLCPGICGTEADLIATKNVSLN